MPDVAAYTSSFLAFVTALSNFLQYLIMSEILWNYALFSSFFGLIGFYLGLNIILKFMIENDRRSYIVLTLCFVILLSAILVFISGVNKIIIDINRGKGILEFGNLC